MSVRVYYPPDEFQVAIRDENSRSIFLAGSIEMGKAIDWQQKLIDKLRIQGIRKQLNILNPRRLDWNVTWEQSINNPHFVEQVEWELIGLQNSNIIVMYLAAHTVSPISLLELGLHALSGKLIVYCEEGFTRKGNVDIVCRAYGITQVFSENELLDAILERLS